MNKYLLVPFSLLTTCSAKIYVSGKHNLYSPYEVDNFPTLILHTRQRASWINSLLKVVELWWAVEPQSNLSLLTPETLAGTTSAVSFVSKMSCYISPPLAKGIFLKYCFWRVILLLKSLGDFLSHKIFQLFKTLHSLVPAGYWWGLGVKWASIEEWWVRVKDEREDGMPCMYPFSRHLGYHSEQNKVCPSETYILGVCGGRR